MERHYRRDISAPGARSAGVPLTQIPVSSASSVSMALCRASYSVTGGSVDRRRKPRVLGNPFDIILIAAFGNKIRFRLAHRTQLTTPPVRARGGCKPTRQSLCGVGFSDWLTSIFSRRKEEKNFPPGPSARHTHTHHTALHRGARYASGLHLPWGAKREGGTGGKKEGEGHSEKKVGVLAGASVDLASVRSSVRKKTKSFAILRVCSPAVKSKPYA
jgi:hypothetical protein